MEVRKIKEISSIDIYENPSEGRGRKIKMNTRHFVVLNKFIGQDVVLQHHGNLQDFRIIKSPSEAILCVENAIGSRHTLILFLGMELKLSNMTLRVHLSKEVYSETLKVEQVHM
jgi:hypothetical protein